jgi:hypothetical protein
MVDVEDGTDWPDMPTFVIFGGGEVLTCITGGGLEGGEESEGRSPPLLFLV